MNGGKKKIIIGFGWKQPSCDARGFYYFFLQCLSFFNRNEISGGNRTDRWTPTHIIIPILVATLGIQKPISIRIMRYYFFSIKCITKRYYNIAIDRIKKKRKRKTTTPLLDAPACYRRFACFQTRHESGSVCFFYYIDCRKTIGYEQLRIESQSNVHW